MRRLLSPVRLLLIHLPSAGAHACRHTCCPRRFSASLSSARSMGLGRCRSSAPAHFLMEANDDNHSWYANRG